jgi:hypothetical protein
MHQAQHAGPGKTNSALFRTLFTICPRLPGEVSLVGFCEPLLAVDAACGVEVVVVDVDGSLLSLGCYVSLLS